MCQPEKRNPRLGRTPVTWLTHQRLDGRISGLYHHNHPGGLRGLRACEIIPCLYSLYPALYPAVSLIEKRSSVPTRIFLYHSDPPLPSPPPPGGREQENQRLIPPKPPWRWEGAERLHIVFTASEWRVMNYPVMGMATLKGRFSVLGPFRFGVFWGDHRLSIIDGGMDLAGIQTG